MAIPIATTPTITITFTDDELDLTAASGVYVTLKQNNVELTKTGTDIAVSAKQIELVLEQDDTVKFAEGFVNIQVNWVFPNGKRACSDVQTIQMSRQLLKAVIE